MAAPAVFRRLTTGTTGNHYPDDPGIPEDIETEATPGPWPTTAQVWADVLEDPQAPGLAFTSANPAIPDPTTGALPLPGAYDGSYATQGPVTAFGEESQAMGRVMRFGNNRPDRSPDLAIGEAPVIDGPSYLDELAAVLANNGTTPPTDAQLYDSLLMYR